MSIYPILESSYDDGDEEEKMRVGGEGNET